MKEVELFGKQIEATPSQEAERDKSVEELYVSSEQIEEIGKILNEPYIIAFTKAVAEGKTFKEAEKLAKEESGESGVEGYAYGDIMSYKSESAGLCVFIDSHKGTFNFIYPTNINVSNELQRLAQNIQEK